MPSVGKEALPAFQFTLKHARVLIENRAPLHARAEIAKAALGRAKRDLDVDAGVDISAVGAVLTLAYFDGAIVDAAGFNPARL